MPSNTVCVAYIKKQSISVLNNLTTEIISTEKIDLALGIFELSFSPHKGELGTYYSVNFEWRKREKNEETQLQLIKEFWQVCHEDLIDLDGTRDMSNISMLSSIQLECLIANNNHNQKQLTAQ